MDQARAHLTAAVQEAAAASLPHVSAVVLGLAGNPGACRALAARVLRPLLPHGPPVRVVGDTVTAFAAGTAAPSGTVLISGTGAIAAKITDHEQTATSDGYGWLLGDEGSGFWLGHAAARLAGTAAQVHEPGLPIVLAGGVLTAQGPVSRAVHDLLADAVTAGDAAGGAAWLAARELLPEADAQTLHAAFTKRPDRPSHRTSRAALP
jgi:N-acetylglucosamine kinase-like BadF-type ATPase